MNSHRISVTSGSKSFFSIRLRLCSRVRASKSIYLSSTRMTGGGSAVAGFDSVPVPLSGAGITSDGGASGVVGAGEAAAGVVLSAAGGRDVPFFADFPDGACQPGMINSVPGRIFAGSEILFAVAISPTFT